MYMFIYNKLIFIIVSVSQLWFKTDWIEMSWIKSGRYLNVIISFYII